MLIGGPVSRFGIKNQVLPKQTSHKPLLPIIEMKRKQLNLSMPGAPPKQQQPVQPVVMSTPSRVQPAQTTRTVTMKPAIGQRDISPKPKPLAVVKDWKSEMETIIQLFHTYDKKEYLTGRLMRLHDLNSDGHAARHREWQTFDVSVKGSELIFTNITTKERDSIKFSDGQVDWIGVFQKLTGAVMSKYGVLSLNSAGSNRYFLKSYPRDVSPAMPTTDEIIESMRLWPCAIRISQFEELVLNQMFTEILVKRPAVVQLENQIIPTEVSDRSAIRMEGTLKFRLAGHTKWKDYYCICERLQSDLNKMDGKAQLLVFEDKKDAEKHLKQPAKQLMKNPLKYVTFKLVNINQAFALYPDREDFIETTSIFKIQHGSIMLGDKAPRDLLKTSVPNLINWGQKVDELARKQPHIGYITQPFVLCMAENQEMMIRWLLNIWSIFDLHGKGMLPDDENNGRLRQIMSKKVSDEQLLINVGDIKNIEMRSRDICGYHREFLKITLTKEDAQKCQLQINSVSDIGIFNEGPETLNSLISDIDAFSESDSDSSSCVATAIKLPKSETVHFVDSDSEDDVKTIASKKPVSTTDVAKRKKQVSPRFASLKDIEGKPIAKTESKKPERLQVKPPTERRISKGVKLPSKEVEKSVKPIVKQVLPAAVKPTVAKVSHRKALSVPSPKPEIKSAPKKPAAVINDVEPIEKEVNDKEEPVQNFSRQQNRKTLVAEEESKIVLFDQNPATPSSENIIQEDMTDIEKAKMELRKERELLQKQMEAFESMKLQMQQSVYAVSEYGHPASVISYQAPPFMMGMAPQPPQVMNPLMVQQMPIQYGYPPRSVSPTPSDSASLKHYADVQNEVPPGETGGGLISLISENTKSRSTAYNPQLGLLQPHSGRKNTGDNSAPVAAIPAGQYGQIPQFRNGMRAVSQVGVAQAPVNPYMNMNQMHQQMMHQQQFYAQYHPSQQYPNGFPNQFYGGQK